MEWRYIFAESIDNALILASLVQPAVPDTPADLSSMLLDIYCLWDNYNCGGYTCGI